MWGHVLISIVVLLTSLLYHYHFNEPASIIDYPETHYDYIIGEFALVDLRLSAFLSLPRGDSSAIFSSFSLFWCPSTSIFNQRGFTSRNDKLHCIRLRPPDAFSLEYIEISMISHSQFSHKDQINYFTCFRYSSFFLANA